MLEKHLKEDLMFLKLDVSSRDELFKKMSDIYVEKKLVKEDFYQFLSEREDDYPTGLQLEDYAVAIPHGNPEHIKESFVSVVSLTKPIMINKMEDASEKIPIDLFFFLGLGDGNTHLGILRETMGLIQKKELVDKLREAQSSKEAFITIQSELKSHN